MLKRAEGISGLEMLSVPPPSPFILSIPNPINTHFFTRFKPPLDKRAFYQPRRDEYG
jgi:hypothetical protein